MNVLKKAVLGTAVAATALATATPAMARDYGYRHHDNTGAAVAAGVVGLAIGAIIASGNHDRYDDRYYNGGYYNQGYYNGGYYPNYTYNNGGWYDGYRYQNGYFYDRQGHRSYDRDGWQRRYQRDYRRGY